MRIDMSESSDDFRKLSVSNITRKLNDNKKTLDSLNQQLRSAFSDPTEAAELKEEIALRQSVIGGLVKMLDEAKLLEAEHAAINKQLADLEEKYSKLSHRSDLKKALFKDMWI